ncbi:MAG TPA: hypothetical protein PK657_08435 [Legionella sp.]|nr:hypothetical protein [Legionella sp.]
MPGKNPEFYTKKEVLIIAAISSIIFGSATGIASAILKGSFIKSAAVSGMGLFSYTNLINLFYPVEKKSDNSLVWYAPFLIGVASEILGIIEARLLFNITLSKESFAHHLIGPLILVIIEGIGKVLMDKNTSEKDLNPDMPTGLRFN